MRVDVAGLEVGIRHLNILRPFHTLNDLLDERDFVLGFDSLEATDKGLVTLPRPNLPQTLKIQQPFIFVTQDIRYQIGQQRICALNPLSWIDALGDVLESVGEDVIEFSVDDAFRCVELLH